MERLQRELLGSLAEDLREAAGLRESEEWREAQSHVAGLERALRGVRDGAIRDGAIVGEQT